MLKLNILKSEEYSGLKAASIIFRFIILYAGTTTLLFYILQDYGYNINILHVLAILFTLFLIDKIASIASKTIEVYAEGRGIVFEQDIKYFFTYLIWSSIIYLSLILTPIHEMPHMVYFITIPAIWFLIRGFKSNIQFNLSFIKWLILALIFYTIIYFFPIIAFFIPVILLFVCYLYLKHIRYYRYLIISLLIAIGIIAFNIAFIEYKPWTVNLVGSIAFYDMLLWSSFEELYSRAVIPFLGLGLPNYIFIILHFPKTLYSLVMLFDDIFIFIITSIIIVSILAVVTMFIAFAWIESGIIGSWLTHAIYNTIVVLSIIYGMNFMTILALIPFAIVPLLKRKGL